MVKLGSYCPGAPIYARAAFLIFSSRRRPEVDLKTLFVVSGFFTFMLFPLILRFTYLLSALIPMEETSYSPGPGFAAAGVGAADYCFMKRFSVVPNAPMLDCQFFKGPSAFLAVYYPGPGSSLP
jgi:hypothetical protein